MTKYLLAICIFTATTLAAAPMYQWVDENGVTHFSERPPTSQPGMRAVDIQGIPTVSGENELTTSATPESQSSQQSTPVTPEVEKIENPIKSPELCEQASKNITIINQNRRLRAPDPETGELRYISDNEKAEQLTNWQKRAETYCE